MALLSGMMRNAAFTGRTEFVDAWFAGRQFGRWAQQPVSTAARPAPPADRAGALRELTDLHRRGVLTDAECRRLRTRLGV